MKSIDTVYRLHMRSLGVGLTMTSPLVVRYKRASIKLLYKFDQHLDLPDWH